MRQLIPVLIALIALNAVLIGCGNDNLAQLRAHATETGETIEIKVTDKDGNVIRDLKVTPTDMSGSFLEITPSADTTKAPPPDTAQAPPADAVDVPPVDAIDAPLTPALEPLYPADLEAVEGAQASLPDRQ